MPDEAQPTPTDDKAPRRTAMQVAEAAHALAESARTEADNAVGLIDSLSEKVTDLGQRLSDIPQLPPLPAMPELPDLSAFATRGQVDALLAAFATRDQVDGRIAEALHPIQEDLGRAMVVEANVQAFREEMGGYQGAVNRKIDNHAGRLTELEKLAGERESNPVADTLAEDFLADQVERLVRERLDGLLARVEELERRPSPTLAPVHELTVDHVTGSLAQRKVLELMRRVDKIGKDRQAEKSAGGYSFRGIDEAMDAVGHAMREIGLIGSPGVRSVSYDTREATNQQGRAVLWTTARLVGTYTFTAPEDGSSHTIETVGEGRDSSDKATSKAASMALKYGLLQGLMIPVTGMPDGDAENPEVYRQRPAQTAEQAPAPNTPPGTQADRATRAQRAVEALQKLHLIRDPQERYNRLVAIHNQLRQENLMEQPATWKGETAPMGRWVEVAQRLLAERPPAHDDVPPEPGY